MKVKRVRLECGYCGIHQLNQLGIKVVHNLKCSGGTKKVSFTTTRSLNLTVKLHFI